MPVPNISEILVTPEEEQKIRDSAPDKLLPLNPTAQGFSGAQVRVALAKSIVGDNSLLNLMLEKFPILAEILTDMQAKIDSLFLVNQHGVVVFESNEEQNETIVPIGTIAITKQNGG